MSDIVDRLVRFAGGNVCISTDTEVEAAVEIDRLRAENEKLRAALKRLHEAATEATEDLIFGEWWKEELDEAAAALKETDNA